MARPTPLRLLSPLHRASRQIALFLEDRLEGMPVAGKDLHLLSYLRSYGPCSVGEVARVFGLKGSTLTGMLDRLERLGMLERQLDPEDRRSFLLELTPRGTTQANEGNQVLREFEIEVLGRVAARDLAGFERVIEAIAAATRITVRPNTVRPDTVRPNKEK